ncbi:ExbD/TolR family protein [Antarcticirhabdus aurantiaca]|uniref:Biopolymer transporter ExbD n=1 Tax=Antarcticirhabdus aurantiaca TaxID=2606717 RepID=A0ACD4NVH9_9HYPH|nr:biopolymer transporter ExbD [Antarcticirhabdus aurantiaca]WAJ30793.1 biopolymer transporter ExbD [Jeongeuplla avenae]
MRPPRQVNEDKGFGAFFGETGAARPSPREPMRPIIRLPRPERRTHVDALLPLINIVFLLLIFLMMSGTLGTPLPGGLTLARSTAARDPAVVANALIIKTDGSFTYRGRPVAASDLAAAVRREGHGAREPLTVVADGGMPAEAFLAVMRRLSDDGIASISLVTAPTPSGRP